MSQTLIRYAVADRIATFTLDRPDRLNAVNAEMTRQMRDVLDRFEADDDVWVGVLTGSGTRAFCAGMDLLAFAAGEGPEINDGPDGFAGFTARRRTKPVIAAVNGAAMGGGCEIVLACDLVVAAETATFAQSEVKRGLYAAAGGVFRLPRTIPRVKAMEMLLTGDPIDAATAVDLGLANATVPADRLMEEALALARRITANAPLAVRETLMLARMSPDLSEDELWTLNAASWKRIQATDDASEGPRAFAAKRPPRWSGR